MSVSIFVEMGPITSYKVACSCPNVKGEVFDSYEDASLFLITLQDKNVSLPGCADEYCIAGGIFINGEHDAAYTSEVNMSNMNARVVFEHLGVDVSADGWGGEFDARDLMARIDIALSVAPESAAIPTIDEGNMIYCGRPEGYVQDRLSEIISVCEDAIKLNRQVVWG